MKKLQKTAKGLNTVFGIIQKIVLVAAIVAVGVMAVLTVAEFINSDTVIGDNMNVVEIGPLSLELNEIHTPDDMKMLSVGWVGAVTAAVYAVLAYISLNQVKAILAPMSEGDPFGREISGRIKNLAWLSLAIGIVQNIAGAVELFVSFRTFHLHSLLVSENINHVTFNYSFETGFIILFFVLLLMSYIFSYGAELQQLSDETL